MVGRDLVLRSVGFQVAFLTAAAVAARMGTAQLAAHQVALQLWEFSALVLDSFAIAAQSLVGAALGGSDVAAARRFAGQTARYGLAGRSRVRRGAGRRLARCCPPRSPRRRRCSTNPTCSGRGSSACSRSPGVVFALDGVLIGAGDVAFLRTITLVAASGSFVPLNLAALHWQLGDRRRLGRADRLHRGPLRRHGAAHPRRSLARRRSDPMSAGRATAVTDGLAIVDKPAGMTSHDVVARFRRSAHTRRVGHAGTLDPMATGVLVLAVGQATRLLNHLDLDAKTYSARIRLGQATTTDDAEGEPLSTSSAARPDRSAGASRDGGVHRRHHAGAVDGVGDQGRRRAGLQAGAGRRGRRAARPARSRFAGSRRSAFDPRRRLPRRRRRGRLLGRHLRPGARA